LEENGNAVCFPVIRERGNFLLYPDFEEGADVMFAGFPSKQNLFAAPS
jgi:hypothetical protein